MRLADAQEAISFFATSFMSVAVVVTVCVFAKCIVSVAVLRQVCCGRCVAAAVWIGIVRCLSCAASLALHVLDDKIPMS